MRKADMFDADAFFGRILAAIIGVGFSGALTAGHGI